MKGMERGYLNSSPFDAFTLAIIIQITLRNARKIIIGIPIIIIQSGIDRTIYSKIDI